MLKKPIKELKGKNVAIVAMGNSQLDYHMAITHSQEFDEVWVINAMIGVIPNPDRAFVMDPVSRFFDSEDAGDMTNIMKQSLPKIKCPIYTCVLDERVPALELYPIEALIKDTECGYINNTVAYAIAFACWNQVGNVNLFGADFTYKGNLYFAEMGRACCEYWLAKCMERGIGVEIAVRSNLLDANVDLKDKLYGYHRLPDPVVSYSEDGKMKVCKWSEVIKQQAVPFGVANRYGTDITWLDRANTPIVPTPPEPTKY
jgi:hypothetical protein